MPITVLLMTFNRLDALRICLQHLEAQTCREFEVVVLVDGSTDGTVEELERYQGTAPYPLRYMSQPNRGIAKARNAGLREVRSPLCVLIGDDIFVSPDFVRVHLEFHRAHPELEAAALGYTRWDERRQTVTPLMRWMERDGIQFGYGELLAGAAPSWRHFYTSNLSLKTELLRRYPTDESFGQYGLEDIELGYRLERQAGLRLYFLAEAVAEHLHPTDYVRACRRMVHVGTSAYQMAELWPEFRRPATRGRTKRLLLNWLTGPRVALPLLARVTAVLNSVWMPNPLTLRVLELHERFGYERAAKRGPS